MLLQFFLSFFGCVCMLSTCSAPGVGGMLGSKPRALNGQSTCSIAGLRPRHCDLSFPSRKLSLCVLLFFRSPVALLVGGSLDVSGIDPSTLSCAISLGVCFPLCSEFRVPSHRFDLSFPYRCVCQYVCTRACTCTRGAFQQHTPQCPPGKSQSSIRDAVHPPLDLEPLA